MSRPEFNATVHCAGRSASTKVGTLASPETCVVDCSQLVPGANHCNTSLYVWGRANLTPELPGKLLRKRAPLTSLSSSVSTKRFRSTSPRIPPNLGSYNQQYHTNYLIASLLLPAPCACLPGAGVRGRRSHHDSRRHDDVQCRKASHSQHSPSATGTCL